MKQPVVSVVIPTRDGAMFLLETLQSVFSQTFTDYEVIVVDDGSTDRTVARLQPLRDRIRVIRQPHLGIGAARNAGLDEAKGKYVALLDHDDLWLPEKLAVQVAFLESRLECVAAGVPYAYSTSPARCAFDLDAVKGPSGVVERPLKVLAEGNVFLMSSSLMFDRQRALGLRYATRQDCIEDVPFQIGLFSRGAFGIAGRGILMMYRVHSSNYSAQASFYYNGIRLLREMDCAGRFAPLTTQQRDDLDAFLGHLGRAAAVRQVLGGHRIRGLRTYLREFSRQLQLRRFRFLLVFPFVLLSPQWRLNYRWPEARQRQSPLNTPW